MAQAEDSGSAPEDRLQKFKRTLREAEEAFRDAESPDEVASAGEDLCTVMFVALDYSQNALEQIREHRDTYRAEVERLEAELEDAHEEIDQLREGQQLLNHISDASALDVEERAAVCLQSLYNDATSNGGRATMTAREAWNLLGRSVDRSRMYPTLRKAADLVGENEDGESVVYFKKEPKGHDPPSRLVLDLDNGRLPTTVAGQPIKHGRS